MNLNTIESTFKPPYTVVILDATDAYYYADVMGSMEEFDTVESLNLAKKLADSLFIVKNYRWKSLEEMNSCDGGYDVRIYDKNHSCIYAAHTKYEINWIED